MAWTALKNQLTYRKLYKREAVKDEPGVSGVRSFECGIEELTYEVTLDMKQIDTMAKKAGRNKAGVCRDGATVVKITSRRLVQGEPGL